MVNSYVLREDKKSSNTQGVIIAIDYVFTAYIGQRSHFWTGSQLFFYIFWILEDTALVDADRGSHCGDSFCSDDALHDLA